MRCHSLASGPTALPAPAHTPLLFPCLAGPGPAIPWTPDGLAACCSAAIGRWRRPAAARPAPPQAPPPTAAAGRRGAGSCSVPLACLPGHRTRERGMQQIMVPMRFSFGGGLCRMIPSSWAAQSSSSRDPGSQIACRMSRPSAVPSPARNGSEWLTRCGLMLASHASNLTACMPFRAVLQHSHAPCCLAGAASQRKAAAAAGGRAARQQGQRAQRPAADTADSKG